MSESAPAIRIESARKVYETAPGRTRVAVEDVSLLVEPGAIHGLLGPNGAGKTTTLKMLLGLVRPTAGTFEVLGRDARTRAGREHLGFLAEAPYFPQQLTAGAALRLYARLAGVRDAEIAARTAELLEQVGLGGRERARLATFSRGMLQRLGIAQAVIGRPRVVILDEPASGLDPVGQRDVRNVMTSLRDEGVTVLLSSHQLSEVEAVCDRVTILNRGTVAANGRIDDLLRCAGRSVMTAAGLAPEALSTALPEALSVTREGEASVAVVPDGRIRAAVDAIDDAGGTVLSVSPQRESLEDYFARMLAGDRTEVA